MRHYFYISFILLTGLLLAACDDLSMDEVVQSAPQITDFAPKSGSIGTLVTISGEHLDNVVEATVGGVPAELVERISKNQLTIRVTGAARTGKLYLRNSIGGMESEAVFTVQYLAPAVQTAEIPSEIEMGSKLLISGQRMNVISKVIFTAVGMTTGHEADIISQSEREIVVKIPYVESDDAQITLTYFDGTAEVSTAAGDIPAVKVKRYQPNVTTTTFAAAHVGDVVTLDGTYMNKIDKVMLGTIACTITSQTETQVKFVVPASEDMKDGDNTLPLSIVYFDGIESRELTDKFIVKVPFVYFWEDRTIYGQGRDVTEMVSFFSPETGVAYHNSLWREVVDPISYKYQAATCSANQKPAVTEAEYNSVNPYFYFSGVAAGNLQINSPAGSNGQLKNFFFQNNSSNDYRVTGANANCYFHSTILAGWYKKTHAEGAWALKTNEKMMKRNVG